MSKAEQYVLRRLPIALALAAGAGLCLGAEVSPGGAAPTGAGFSFEALREQAQALAAKPFQPDNGVALPDFLKNLDYDGYQQIEYRPDRGPWFKDHLRFTFQFFHPGYLYKDPVRIHLIENGRGDDFPFSPDQFKYGTNRFPKPLPPGLAFAGLRVLYPVNRPDKQDEVASFVGATFFRLLGAHQVYGAAARGLAIDTAEPNGEEFPRFTDFWVEKPGAQADALRLFALLNSPSAAGAYQFLIKPGQTTVVDIEASVFFRKPVEKVGLAPLTSMYFKGKTTTRYIPDFRPEIHDSDGLLVHEDSWLWRPLINPEKKFQITRFPSAHLRGFGLLQRDRDFRDYQDLQARYDKRPSLWVQPQNDWSTGAVELVEIPTPNEWNDNIIVYWVPQPKPAAGQELHWTYSLSACLAVPEQPPLLRVRATRLSPGTDKTPPRFVIDFSGDTLAGTATNAPVAAQVSATHGQVQNLVTARNEVTGGWRAFFDLVNAGKDPVELRLFLHRGPEVLSETWSYRYQAP